MDIRGEALRRMYMVFRDRCPVWTLGGCESLITEGLRAYGLAGDDQAGKRIQGTTVRTVRG